MVDVGFTGCVMCAGAWTAGCDDQSEADATGFIGRPSRRISRAEETPDTDTAAPRHAANQYSRLDYDQEQKNLATHKTLAAAKRQVKLAMVPMMLIRKCITRRISLHPPN